MRKLSVLAFGVALTFSTAAFAQTQTVTVDLSAVSAELAAELGIDVDDVPATIDLSADIAAQVCGIDVETIGDSCVASVSTAGLAAAIESDLGDNDNSARQFAPGQQEGPAREAAPGQQDGDAKDSAPGQMKKSDDATDTNGSDSAPGHEKKAGE